MFLKTKSQVGLFVSE